MDVLTEELLKEIERQDRVKELYGNVEIDVFNIDVGNQIRKWWEDTRYFATKSNKIQVESKMQIRNPLRCFSNVFLFITLVFTTNVIRTNKKKLATKKEIENTVKKSTDYVLALMNCLFESYSTKIQEGDNTELLLLLERVLFKSQGMT